MLAERIDASWALMERAERPADPVRGLLIGGVASLALWAVMLAAVMIV